MYQQPTINQKYYDVYTDDLPFDDASVKYIYCSHMLEHITEHESQSFLEDMMRVLMPGGVARIVVPDGRFLFERMLAGDDDYFHWREISYRNRKMFKRNSATVCEKAIYELFTYACPAYQGFREENLPWFHALRQASSWEEFLEIVALIDCSLFQDDPGAHKSVWDFAKLSESVTQYARVDVIESKFQGSVSPCMSGSGFDLSYPNMSLFVDIVKGV